MSTNSPFNQYFETQILTASPGKLLLMTYDAAIRFTRTAQDKMKAGDLYEQGNNIRKVQNILLEMMSSLDPKADRQLAANLDALYTYMFDRLTHANINDDTKALDEVLDMLTELRGTWAEAEQLARTSTQAKAA
jgi:flagellar protein FliS